MKKDNYKIGISILDCNYLDLRSELKKIEESGADFIHLDVMDGNFVSQLAFGQKMLELLVKESPVPVHAHLMIQNADEQIESYIRLRPYLLTVHFETCRHLDNIINMIISEKIGAGIALNPSTPVSFLENVLYKINRVLILTVNPGFGGQKFIEGILPKIRKTKGLIKNYYETSDDKNIINIGVDGGINTSTIIAAKNAGADTFIIGSAFFKNSDPVKFISNIRELLSGNQAV